MLRVLKLLNPDKEYPMNLGKKWTSQEEKVLLEELHKNMNIHKIAKLHNRTVGGINSRRREIAYKLYCSKIPMELISEKTKLNIIEIENTIKKKENKNSNEFAELAELKCEINNIKNDMEIIKKNLESIKIANNTNNTSENNNKNEEHMTKQNEIKNESEITNDDIENENREIYLSDEIKNLSKTLFKSMTFFTKKIVQTKKDDECFNFPQNIQEMSNFIKKLNSVACQKVKCRNYAYNDNIIGLLQEMKKLKDFSDLDIYDLSNDLEMFRNQLYIFSFSFLDYLIPMDIDKIKTILNNTVPDSEFDDINTNNYQEDQYEENNYEEDQYEQNINQIRYIIIILLKILLFFTETINGNAININTELQDIINVIEIMSDIFFSETDIYEIDKDTVKEIITLIKKTHPFFIYFYQEDKFCFNKEDENLQTISELHDILHPFSFIFLNKIISFETYSLKFLNSEDFFA